jgi:hypothetical protein
VVERAASPALPDHVEELVRARVALIVTEAIAETPLFLGAAAGDHVQ